ncbi:MAG TPA: META domain-containing protein [Motiliproteus sp.]
MLIRLLAPLLLALLAGCAGLKTDLSSMKELHIVGNVDEYDDLPELSATAELVLQVERFDTHGSEVVAEKRIPLNGEQLDVDFSMSFPAPSNLTFHHQLQAVIADRGVPLFASQPQLLNLTYQTIKGVELALQPVDEIAFGRNYHCGKESLIFGELVGFARLNARGKIHHLHPVKAPQGGTRYTAIDQTTTRLFYDGSRLIAAFEDERLPDCVAAPKPSLPLSASGETPLWGLYASSEQIVLNREDRSTLTLSTLSTSAEGNDFILRAGAILDPLRARLTPQLCQPQYVKVPRPYTVKVISDKHQLEGCGGDAGELLQGVEWQLIQLDGEPPLRRANIDLNFSADGKLQGYSACNRYRANWKINDERLQIDSIVATRIACPAPLQQQESRFYALLADVEGFSFDGYGTLVLHAKRSTLKARAALR